MHETRDNSHRPELLSSELEWATTGRKLTSDKLATIYPHGGKLLPPSTGIPTGSLNSYCHPLIPYQFSSKSAMQTARFHEHK